MGYGVSVVESAVCHHAGGASSGGIPHATKFYLTQRNRIRVMIKNYSTRKMLIRLPIACSLIITGGMFLGIKARRAQYFVSIIKAFAWNLFALQSTLIERYRTQGERGQGEEEIEKAMSTYSMDICVLKRYVIGS
jgi:GT2 family glycosyltransferase